MRPSDIGLGRLIIITLAVVAPATSVFLAYGAGYERAGTGIMLAYGGGALLSLLMMLSYAELGSLFPEAGGDYALAARSLGPRAGRLVGTVFALKGIVLPAVLVLSAAVYLHGAWPAVSWTATAAVMLMAVLVLALLDLRTGTLVVAVMVAAEALVYVWFVVAAVHTIALPEAAVPLRPLPQPGHWSGIMAAAVPALYGLNGPQACLYYSEEARARPASFGRIILWVSLLTIAIELFGVTLGTLALKSMQATPHETAPLLTVIIQGHQPLLLLAVSMALFNSALATTMSYGRIYQAMARDRFWPEPLNRWLVRVDRRGAPRGALLFMVALNLFLLAIAPIDALIVLLGSLVMLVYGVVAVGALRVRPKTSRIPFRMPFWPLPPLLALGGLAALLRFVPWPELVLMAAVIGVSLFEARPRHPR